jgi:uncharacterized OB-fold protein
MEMSRAAAVVSGGLIARIALNEKPDMSARDGEPAAKERELRLQRCHACGTYLFYPRYLCTACGSDDLRWCPVSGRGTVFTFTVARRPTHPGLADKVPYIIAVVELAEGPKLTTNLVDIDPDDVVIGLPVQASFEDVDDSTLVQFRPVGPGR